MWWVYVLVNETGRTYVGITKDTSRRTRQHNGHLKGGAKATRRGRPWNVGTRYGPYTSRGEAQRIEYAVKKLRGLKRLSWMPPDAP